METDYLALYSANCLTCKHLCPDTGVREFEDCHFEAGNKQCPAKGVKVVVVGEALDYARKVLRARDKRKPKLEARLMKHVGLQPATFQDRFYKYLENGGRLNIKD